MTERTLDGAVASAFINSSPALFATISFEMYFPSEKNISSLSVVDVINCFTRSSMFCFFLPAMLRSTKDLTTDAGIEKFVDSRYVAFHVLIPTTVYPASAFAFAVISGPPEFPASTCAECWISVEISGERSSLIFARAFVTVPLPSCHIGSAPKPGKPADHTSSPSCTAAPLSVKPFRAYVSGRATRAISISSSAAMILSSL